MLAERVITEGGVVFGARFDDNWEVIHDYTETIEGLEAFRGSKYVQSLIHDSYRKTSDFLKNGRPVLFSGTPCQISGLKKYLKKDYANLFTVDVVCHGVPSPLVWRDYLARFDKRQIDFVSTKDKKTGWRKYSITLKDKEGNVIFTERASKNKYLLAFSQNLTLRLSCFNCPAKSGKSGSDIMLADYWGIDNFYKEMNDNKGVSFLCAFTPKGLDFLKNINLIKKVADYDASISFNPCITNSTPEPPLRFLFWKTYNEDKKKAIESVRAVKISLIKRIFNLLRK